MHLTWPWTKKKARKARAKKPKEKEVKIMEMTPEQEERLNEIRGKIVNLQRMTKCPESHRLSNDCVCMDCPKREVCGAEEERRSRGCVDIVITCSVKHQLQAKNKDTVSDFGDLVAAVLTRRVVSSLTHEEKDNIAKEKIKAKAREEEELKDAKKEGDKGPVPATGNGPGFDM